MTSLDLDKYWGVQLKGLQFDHARMAITMELFWTTGAASKEAKLTFHGVTSCELQAEKVFGSDVVELVSLEEARAGDCVRVSGELSNYAFRINCAEVNEQLNGGNCFVDSKKGVGDS